MNDPEPSVDLTQAHVPEVQAAPATGDFGAALRAAREAAGISLPTLAGRLRLHVRQVEALERSDLAALPTLIYVRGFVRSCARELRIDVAPLLADLDRRAGVVPGAPLASSAGGFHMARLGDGSRSIVAVAIVGLVIAGIIGTLWPRRASVPSKPAIAEAPVPAPATEEPGPALPAATPTPEAAAPVAAAGTPDGAPPRASLPPPALPSTVPATPAPSVAGNRPLVKAATPRPSDTHAAAVTTSAASAPAPIAAVTPAAPEPAGTAPTASDGATLVLHVHASSWVEVVQANGTSVFSQICPAGSVQTVHAEPPLRIVVGNAGAVEAQFRGNAIDLNRYANANGVARFTLQ